MYENVMYMLIACIVALMATKKQTSLFGDYVASENDQVTTFVKIYEVVTKIGEKIIFVLDGAVWNSEKGCLTLFDGNGNGLTIYATHAVESFTGKPDALRFGSALQRAVKADIGSWEDLVEIIRNNPSTYTLTVEGQAMELNGKEVFARSWNVA